jgi:hypothetical protein
MRSIDVIETRGYAHTRRKKMAKQSSPSRKVISAPPPPSPSHGQDGIAVAREPAKCYLPDLVDLFAAIALAPGDASPHTRFWAGREVAALAGALPSPIPTLPVLPANERSNNGSEPE